MLHVSKFAVKVAYISVWCTTLVAIKKVYIKSKIMSADQQYNSLFTCKLYFRIEVTSVGCLYLAMCMLLGICKILNTSGYLVAFYRGDLNLEGLICMFTLWSKY